jgi:hypothetical protein
MGCTIGPEYESIAIARFPSRDDCEAFLGQVRLWNGVEGLPRVHAVRLADGAQVQIHAVASAQRGLARLVESSGGRVLQQFGVIGDPAGV